MTRRLFIVDKDSGDLLELDPNYTPPPSRAPFIITDAMPALQSHADNQWYDSKSKYYKSVKARGLEIAGGVKKVAQKSSAPWLQSGDDEYVSDIKKAKAMLEAGTAPLTERDKQACKKLNERIKNR